MSMARFPSFLINGREHSQGRTNKIKDPEVYEPEYETVSVQWESKMKVETLIASTSSNAFHYKSL